MNVQAQIQEKNEKLVFNFDFYTLNKYSFLLKEFCAIGSELINIQAGKFLKIKKRTGTDKENIGVI